MKQVGAVGLCIAWLAAFSGCESKIIQNLGSIDAAALLRLDGLHVEIFLQTEEGDRLYWEGSILSTGGPGALPVENLDTQIEIWSLKNGQRHTQVYQGRLRDLHWNYGQPYSYRSLLGIVPNGAITKDKEADSPLGEVDITLKTPKQGDFHITLVNLQIYASGYVGDTGF